MDYAEAPILSSFSSTTTSATSSDTDGAVNRGSGRRFNRRYGRGSTLTNVSLRENAPMDDHDLTYSCVGVVLSLWLIGLFIPTFF